jgi:hypothetical protein
VTDSRNYLILVACGYDLYNGYKVVMNQPKPYLSNQNNIKQYARYKNYGNKQSMLRDNKNKNSNDRNARPIINRGSNKKDFKNGNGSKETIAAGHPKAGNYLSKNGLI